MPTIRTAATGVNGGRARRPARAPVRGLRMPEGADPGLPFPEQLLDHPTALMFLVMREAHRIAARRSAATDGPAGMRFPHFALLAALHEFGPASQKSLSDRLRFDPSDVVAFVDRLEEAGFVRRGRLPHDRRRYSVELTPAGRRALAARHRAAAAMNEELLSSLEPGERALLADLLRRVWAEHPGPR